MNSLKWPLSDPPLKCAGNLIWVPKSLGPAPGEEQFYSISFFCRSQQASWGVYYLKCVLLHIKHAPAFLSALYLFRFDMRM